MHSDRYLTAALALMAAVLPAFSIEPRPQGSFDRNLTVAGPVDLDAATHAGSITVRAGAPGAVRIHATIRVNNGGDSGAAASYIREIEQNPPVHQQGNTIRIDAISDETARRHLSLSYEITVPEETKLRARSGSGSMTAEGIRGPADISTGSGGMTATRIGGELRARTGSGHIRMVTVNGPVDADTGSGGIDGTGLAGSIIARTGSGGIRLEQTVAGGVKARAGSGGVALKLPQQAGFDVRAHTGSGHVSCDQPLEVRTSTRSGSLEGKLRGGGHIVDITTGSGGIRIE
jgi:hypothetical protein